MRWFVVFVGSILLAIGLGIAGLQVFGGVASANPKDSVLSALSRTANEPSVHVSMSTTINSVASGRGTITLIGDEATSSDGLPQGNYTIASPGVTLVERLTHDGIFIDFNNAVKLPNGATWMGIDTSGISKTAAINDISGLFSGSNGDPGQIVSLFAAADKSAVTSHGSALIDGIGTTKYVMTVDFKNIPQKKGSAYEQLLQVLQARVGAAKVPVTVWIDGQGLVRRIDYSVTENVIVKNVPTPVSDHLTLNLSNYGAAVNLVDPAKKTVYVLPSAKAQKFFSALAGS